MDFAICLKLPRFESGGVNALVGGAGLVHQLCGSTGYPLSDSFSGFVCKFYAYRKWMIRPLFFGVLRQRLWTNRLHSTREICGMSNLRGTHFCNISHGRHRRPANFAIAGWPNRPLLLFGFARAT